MPGRRGDAHAAGPVRDFPICARVTFACPPCAQMGSAPATHGTRSLQRAEAERAGGCGWYASCPAAPASAAHADRQHGVLAEVDRDLGPVVAVHDRALRVGDQAAHDRPAHEQPRRTLHGHAVHQFVLGEDRGRRALDNQQAAVFHELVEVHQAFEAHSPSDVVGLVQDAEIRGELRLLVGRRIGPDLGKPVHHRLRGAADVREDDHVVMRAQVAVAQLDVAEVRVRHAEVVERGPHPPFVLGIRPRVHVPDARDVEVVRLHRRRARHGPRRQSQVLQRRLQLRAIRVGDDEGACAELVAGEREVLFRRQHLHVGMLEAERHRRVVARVIDDDHRARSLDAARRLHVGGDKRHGLRLHALVRHGHQLDVPHQLHRPAGVVVRPRVAGRVVLQAEVHVRHGPVWLVSPNDVIAGGHVHAAGLEGGCRAGDLQALAPQRVHHVGHLGLAPLGGRNHPRVRRLVLAPVHGALVLDPVVLEERVAVPRHVVQRDEQRRLLDVRVVARAPLDRRQRRVRPVPLAARGRRAEAEVLDDVGAVALDFVEAADGVLGVGDEEHVVRHPAVVEAVGPDAGHVALGHLVDFGVGQRPPLVDRDRVEGLVVGPGAGGGVEVVRGLVQVVQDRRLPLEERPVHVLGQLEHLAHRVAVVVVGDVLAPVHERRPRLAGLLAVVVGVDVLFLAVHLQHRRDEHDDVVADVLDEGRLFDGQPVRQLDQRLGPAGLARVHAGGDPVDGLRRLDDLPRLRLGGLARVGQGVEVGLVLVERLDGRLVSDGEEHHVAAFFALADRPVLEARRGLRQRLVVALDVLRVGQLAGRAGNAPEELQRRRHLVAGRHVVDQFRADSRVLRVLLDQLRVRLVDLLGGRGLLGLQRQGHGGRRHQDHDEQRAGAEQAGRSSGHGSRAPEGKRLAGL